MPAPRGRLIRTSKGQEHSPSLEPCYPAPNPTEICFQGGGAHVLHPGGPPVATRLQTWTGTGQAMAATSQRGPACAASHLARDTRPASAALWDSSYHTDSDSFMGSWSPLAFTPNAPLNSLGSPLTCASTACRGHRRRVQGRMGWGSGFGWRTGPVPPERPCST